MSLQKSNTSNNPIVLSNLKIEDVVKTIPPALFKKNYTKAWFHLLVNIGIVIFCYFLLAIVPWFFLPPIWVVTGTAITGFFIIAHDCGHYNFAKKRWVNNLIGHLFMTPLLYPFHCWRLRHNAHHNLTNKFGGERWQQLKDMLLWKADPDWQPIRAEIYGNLRQRTKLMAQIMRGPFWWLGTIQNSFDQIFIDLPQVTHKETFAAKFSINLVKIFAVIFIPLLIFTVGFWGLLKFWLIPWLIFHFWFSTFTLIHHTSHKIPWKSGEKWNHAEAQLSGTVHCNYPYWVEFLCHNINYHVPHHVAPAIPFYNLKEAHQSLKKNWNSYLKESDFSWNLIIEIITECQLYDEQKQCYESFNRNE
ncbi:MAG: fatty acid desaturase [Prochloraceae cyanobacterium]